MKNAERVFCTIATKNYLAFVRTLFQSVRTWHPDAKCYALVIDGWEGCIRPGEEAFELLSLERLNIPHPERLCFKYNAMALAAALKPVLLRFLLSQPGCSHVLFLDPDILVTGSLDALFDDLSGAEIVVTPHLDQVFPEDGLQPDDAVILAAGVFNGGAIGVKSGSHSERFLEWWAGKLETKCILSHDGYYFDQKFLDIASATFDGFYVERDAGFNVGYWNLHSRSLRLENGRWFCNDGPLCFFHFSGYGMESPEMISKWTTRHTFSNRPDLQPLFDQYRASVLANGYEESKQWPYTFSRFASGQPITDWVRQQYRDSPERWDGDPFASASLEFFDRKKREPIQDLEGFLKAVRRKLHGLGVSVLDSLFREGRG